MAAEIYLNFDRTCDEAIKMYQKAFSTEDAQIMRYKDMPNYTGKPENGNLILHSVMNIKGSIFHLSDVPEHMIYHAGDNMSILVHCDSEIEVNEIFNQLKVSAMNVQTPQPTFFAKAYGSVKDRFGISWQLIFEK